MTRRIAVVGSGVSGLVAAHILSRTDEVTLFEADERLGGHADTHDVSTPIGPLGIDTGFIVHNERTYPTLLRLFDELGVPTQDSDMSMSVRDLPSGLEYAGALGAKGLFPTWHNAVNPRYLRLLLEIRTFHKRAKALLASPERKGEHETLRSFLESGNFSTYFQRHFSTPLVACVWSCDPELALDYPARYLFTFLEHHGMLTVFGSPTWRTVTGGSRTYVERVAARLSDVRTGTKVTDLTETADGIALTDGSGATHHFDGVVIATHPDQALAMLAEPTRAQHDVLTAITYSDNLAQLHTDESVLPVALNARASWNYQRRSEDDGRVLVTYDLTRLMRLPDTGSRYLVTLNGQDLIDPDKVIATREYAHPIYTPTSVAAQERAAREINTDRIAFAGAWLGWGFHEDGALSGRRAAEHLGGSWETPKPPPRHYVTTVKHSRTAPLRNDFTYDSESWLVDLDHLPGKGFRAQDHIGDPTKSIRANIDELLAGYDTDLAGGRVLMLTQPRSLGHVFNPISVFWCDGADGQQAAVVVEVHNTYGGRHAYVVHPDEQGRASIEKTLYVSPFNDTSGHYTLLVPRPTDRVQVSVTLHRDGQPPFAATLAGHATDLTAPRRSLASHRVAARIRIQGIKLWARRLKVQPRPHDHHRPGA